MRKQDFLPVILLGGIAAFIVVQAVSMRGDSDRVSPPAAAAPGPASAVASKRPQAVPRTAGGDVPSTPASAIPDSTAPTDSADASGDDVELVHVAASDPPPPARDLATTQMLIRDGAPGTYLLDMLTQQNDVIMRWPDRRADAIRVWIEREPTVPDWNAEYPVVVERAFEEWQRAGFPLRFLVLRDSANTEIKIRWVASLPEDTAAGIPARLGMTRKLRDEYGWIHGAEIQIATQDPQGRRLRPETVAGTARHEVGHVLGLGHSPSPKDVMYPESRTTVISATDRATLRLLYILPPGSVR